VLTRDTDTDCMHKFLLNWHRYINNTDESGTSNPRNGFESMKNIIVECWCRR